MKKIIFLLLFTVSIYGQTYQNPTYGTVTEKSNSTDNTPAYFVTSQTDGVHKKTPAALVAKTATVNDSLATKENVANKSDIYTASSSITYASTKALVDGLGTKADTGILFNSNLYTDKIIIYGNSIETGTGAFPRSVYGWNVIAPQKLQVKVDNYAISGTTLVKFFDGDNSGIDRLSIITPAYSSDVRAYVSGIGVNDMYNVNGTYNETNFRTAYNTLIDQLVTNGYPLSKIYLFFPLTSNSNTSIMNATVADIASLKGVNFIDVKSAMDANGGLSLVSGDGIHPNNAGHKIIAETIANAVTGTKYNFTQFNQDISTTGRLNVGVGISGGGTNGLEIRGTNEVNKSGSISLFGNIFLDNAGGLTTPHSIDFGSSSYALGYSTYDNSYLKFYYNTYIGISANDGLTLASGAGGGGRITFKSNLFSTNNITVGETNGPGASPLFFSAGNGAYVGGSIDTSNTSFRGYGGSGIGFSSSDGLAIIAGNGLTPIIKLKNNTEIQGNQEVTGNSSIGSSLSGAQNTPSFLDLGSSYANLATTGSTLKLKIYNGTGFGVDASNGLAILSTAAGNRITSANDHYFSAGLFASSPTFTGTPTAPTATLGTNTTQIATTAFVKNGFVALTGNETIAGIKTFSSNILSNSLSAASSDVLTLSAGGTSLVIDDTNSTIMAAGDMKATNFIRTTFLPGQLLKADGNVTAGYKVYTALLSQSGTSAPTATVLENTLGGTVVWTRNSTGLYTGTLAGVFTANKTWTSITSTATGTVTGAVSTSVDTVTVATSSLDSALTNSAIEIRVYN